MARAYRIGFAGVLFAAAAFGPGCAPGTMPQGEFTRLSQGQTIVAVHNSPRLAFAFFPEEGLKGEAIGKYFGPIGMISGGFSDLNASQELGQKFVAAYGLEDPIVRVQQKTIALLQRDGRIAPVQMLDTVIPEDRGQLRKAVAGEYALVFKTYTWMLGNTSKNPGHYVEAYRAQSHLVRMKDGEVLWSGECRMNKPDVAKAPTLAELTANQGTLVKSNFQEHADACAEQLAAQLLGTAP